MIYETIPKKDYLRMSGRAAQVVNEQSVRYDLPIGGPVINLPKLLRAVHDFIAKHKTKLNAPIDADPMMGGDGDSDALEAYRRVKTEQEELKLAEMKKTLVPQQTMHEELGRLAGILRGAGEQLGKAFGRDAQLILEEALDDFDATRGDRLGHEVEGKPKKKRGKKK